MSKLPTARAERDAWTTVSDETIDDGRGLALNITRYAHHLAPKDWNGQEVRVVVANGWGEARNLWHGPVVRLGRLAVQEGYNFEALTLDDHSEGWKTGAYDQGHRTRDLERTVDYAVETDEARRPVMLLAHSRGAISAQQAAPKLVTKKKVYGVVEIGAAGYTPWQARDFHPNSIARVLLREGLSPANLTYGMHHKNVLNMMFLNAARHVLNPVGTYQEAKAILTTDMVEDAVKLSRRLGGRMIELALQDDPLFPGEMVAARLRQHGFRGDLRILPTTHSSLFIDPFVLRNVWVALVDVTERYDQAKVRTERCADTRRVRLSRPVGRVV